VIQIFKNYEEFLEAKKINPSINGVSIDFAKKYPQYIDMNDCCGCWNCASCIDCTDCKYCFSCVGCINLTQKFNYTRI